MPKSVEDRSCFVIAPIGAEGSDIRLRSDQVLKHIIEPAAGDCGYKAVRADKISEVGLITSQVIQHVVEDALVIADLTGRNPNVFYELAIRHAVRKPVVQIIHATEPIPFDVAASRTVQVDHHDLDSVAKAKEEIVRQIRSAEKNPRDVDSPISAAVELQSLRRSDNPLEKSNAEIISMLQALMLGVSELRDRSEGGPQISPAAVDDLVSSLHVIRHVVHEGGATLPPELMEPIMDHLKRIERVSDHIVRRMGSARRPLYNPSARLRNSPPESEE